MSQLLAMLGAAAGSGTKTYVDDVFSAYTYIGNGGTLAINNGIDLSGKGGLVWIKGRDIATENNLQDTARGINKILRSDTTGAEITDATSVNVFNSNGWSMGAYAKINVLNQKYVSWTFRKAPKFFDVVQFTGTGSPQAIAHSLGVAPGMIIVKRADGATDWAVFHRSLGSTYAMFLNQNVAPQANSVYWNNTDPTASAFTVGSSAATNTSGGTYIAYLFAHDASVDGLIQCGSFTTDSSGNASVSLGWEPQFLLTKASSISGSWAMLDNMRGATNNTTNNSAFLFPHLANSESVGTGPYPTATGFNVAGLGASTTFVYMAIRRSNKPPTSGAQVYGAVGGYWGANPASGQLPISTNFPVDLLFHRIADNSSTSGIYVADRLRGPSRMITSDTIAEATDMTGGTGYRFDSMNSFRQSISNNSSQFAWYFRRAAKFMDTVCYTGTGAVANFTHNLGVTPELMLIKARSASADWAVYFGNPLKVLLLNSTAAYGSDSNFPWNSTAPTASQFTVNNDARVNQLSSTYVAYLFATLAGISKVGSYVGNGSSQTIGCGFAAGARFVLIKRTDAVGDWYLWDTTRGIVAGNDGHLSINTTAGEVTSDDSIDPDSSGFIVNQLAATNININAATYLYLAIA